MRLYRVAAAIILALAIPLTALPAQAENEINASDVPAIRAVIEKQLEAFRRDDGESAFAFAAPSIRAQFGDADRFMAMVRQAYKAIYRPRDVEFGELSVEKGIVAQPVHLIGPDGKPRIALYVLERQPDGSWRIAGCMLVEEPGGSA